MIIAVSDKNNLMKFEKYYLEISLTQASVRYLENVSNS